MEYQPIPNLIKPVHAPERQTGKYQTPVSLLDLIGINIHHKGKQGNDIPLKQASITKNAQSLLGRFWHAEPPYLCLCGSNLFKLVSGIAKDSSCHYKYVNLAGALEDVVYLAITHPLLQKT